jgi:hypothetical protein
VDTEASVAGFLDPVRLFRFGCLTCRGFFGTGGDTPSCDQAVTDRYGRDGIGSMAPGYFWLWIS